MFQRTTENTGDHNVDGDLVSHDRPGEDNGISASGRTEPSVARQIVAGRLRSVLGKDVVKKAADEAASAYHRQRRFQKWPITKEEQRKLIAEYDKPVTVCEPGYASGFTPINALMRVRTFG